MSREVSKSHNKTTLIYHIVMSVKYRQKVLTEDVTATLINVCMDLEDKYDIEFIEIGTDINHVHLLLQGPPTKSVTEIVTLIKSLTARMIFKMNPEVKSKLWGGQFWSSGYWAVTISQLRTENVVKEYVKSQGHDKYDLLHKREFKLEL